MRNQPYIYFDDRNVLHYLKHNGHSMLPAISIACSSKCNLSCPHCIYNAGKRNLVELDLKEKLRLLQRSCELGAKYLQICHEGEPFLDKAVPILIKKAAGFGMKTFIYTNATLVTPEIAKMLYENEVCLGIKLDSLNPTVFNQMLGKNKANEVYNGIQNLIKAGYNKPFKREGKFYTRLSLICTLTSINSEIIEEIKDVARFAWDNNLFFGAARLEKGGRAIGDTWDKYKIPDKQKIIDFIEWCSEQTGIRYWDAQPTPYCIGVCGLQIADNGDVWITEYGGSCDFTEPDGESFPDPVFVIGNVRHKSLKELLDLVWQYREKVLINGILDRKLREYELTKDIYPNGLQDCGSARTYTLFRPFYNYVRNIIDRRRNLVSSTQKTALKTI